MTITRSTNSEHISLNHDGVSSAESIRFDEKDSAKLQLNLLEVSMPDMKSRTVDTAAAATDKAPEQATTKSTASQSEEAKLYPELILYKQALEAISETGTELKQRWEKANSLFHQAETVLERYIEGQGGAAKMSSSTQPYINELDSAIDAFRKSKRSLSGPDIPGKREQEDALRQVIKDLSQQDIVSALRGEKGETMQKLLISILNEDERESLADLDLILNKVQLVSSLRVKHALITNEYANATNDQVARILSEEILKSIAATDPDTFRTSPEIHGLILQSQIGQAMDLSNGKATALAFTDEAQRTIITTQSAAAVLLSNEERTAGASQALRLLAAALALNEQVVNEAWTRWQEGKNYQAFIERARQILDEQKKQANR